MAHPDAGRFMDAARDFRALSDKGNPLEKGNYTISEDGFTATVSQETGTKTDMSTPDFLGGVAVALAETGTLPLEDATAEAIGMLCLSYGLIVGMDSRPDHG